MWFAASQTDITLPPSPMRRRVRAAFLVLVIANICFYIFQFVLLKYIDPSLLNIQYEMALEIGISNVTLESFKPTIGKTLLSFGSSLIGGFLMAYAVAYIIQRNT
jgi:hypothetical protein